jgi:hypothetical protein
MRITVVPLLLAALAGCGGDGESMQGFAAPAGFGADRGRLTLRVVDDPSGAVDVTLSASRPTVSLVFEASGAGTTTFQFTVHGPVQMSVPVDSAQVSTGFGVPDVPAARFDRLTIRLVSAQLAVPGDRVQARDMLGGGGSATIIRNISLDLRSGGTRSVVIDLNSAQWLRRNPNPLPGDPPYAFDGAQAFINAIEVRTS